MDVWTRIVATNIGGIERWARVLVGLGLIVLALALPTGWGWLGLYPLLTGLIGISPIYKLLGIYTCRRPAYAAPPRPRPPITRTDVG